MTDIILPGSAPLRERADEPRCFKCGNPCSVPLCASCWAKTPDARAAAPPCPDRATCEFNGFSGCECTGTKAKPGHQVSFLELYASPAPQVAALTEQLAQLESSFAALCRAYQNIDLERASLSAALEIIAGPRTDHRLTEYLRAHGNPPVVTLANQYEEVARAALSSSTVTHLGESNG